MSLKENINKIHVDLKDVYGDVVITEKSSLVYGSYIELSLIKENKELKMIIEKSDLEVPYFKWKYFSNPLDDNSFLVERNSSIQSILTDVEDIFNKNRFDSEYLKINK